MNDAKEEIKSRLQVEDVVGRYVELKRTIQEGKELSQDVVERIKKEILVKRAKLRAMHILERADRTEAELASKLKQGL